MMNSTMPYDMMAGNPLLWIVIGFLVGLLLVTVVTWLLTHWRNVQRLDQMHHAPQPHDSFLPYEQGYQPPEPSPEAYQEGGHAYTYPQSPYEQPEVRYQQEIPLQQ